MAQLKSGSTIGGTGVLLNEANSVSASNITDGTVTAAKLAGAGTAGQVLTSTGGSTAPSMQDLSVDSSSLSDSFTVETGKTVAAGDVVNYAAGKIGDNPVVNSQSALVEDSTYDYNYFNESGTIAVTSEQDGSNHQVRTGVIQSNGSINWNSPHTVYSNYSGAGTSIRPLSGDQFMMYGSEGSAYNGGTKYGYYATFTVNATTGAVTNNGSTSHSQGCGQWASGHSQCRGGVSINTYMIPQTDQFFATVYKTYGGNSQWLSSTSQYTVSSSVGHQSSSNDSQYTASGNWMHCQSNTKLLGIDNASWRFGSWNGSTLSSVSTITFDSTYSSNLRVYKPDTTTDKWYAAFINTSNQLVIGSYSISGSTITRDYLKVVINSGAGVTIGDIIGSGSTGLVLGYENDSKGYVATFSADSSTREITGVGSVVTHNLSNEAPIPWGVNSTNKFATAYSSSSNLINTRVLTVNAYATSALNWLGVAQTSGTAGQSVNIVMDGIAAGFSGLTTGEKYYYDTSTFDASVTTTVTDYLIGTATSATEIKLNA